MLRLFYRRFVGGISSQWFLTGYHEYLLFQQAAQIFDAALAKDSLNLVLFHKFIHLFLFLFIYLCIFLAQERQSLTALEGILTALDFHKYFV
jgi:hypothetical protein